VRFDHGYSHTFNINLCPADEQLDKIFETEIDFKTIPLETLRKLINKDGQYYPKFEGCDNAYRDGYTTEPPRKPRASYIFFQTSMRPYFQKRNPDAAQSELMKIAGETWQNMSEEEQAPFIQLAKEEAQQFEVERVLLEKAQRPSAMWQPLRRCRMVLDRLSKDGFASIFLEPVDLDDFPDYEDHIDHPMDLGTVRQKLDDKKYLAPENFARDMRKVRCSRRGTNCMCAVALHLLISKFFTLFCFPLLPA
jgi:hypothetical protein